VREIAFGNRLATEVALSDPGVDLGDPPQAPFVNKATAVNIEAAFAGDRERVRVAP
jgi:hypothetical protein|tara:strand:+ start:213 stop:380 length:168 start_codon:yes stop_codon:yes gene_type:complete